MSKNDEFRTLRRASRAETRVSASRFLAFAYPVAGRGEVQAHLEELRREFHDATHHCYAFRLGVAGDDFRTHDAGEPGGTAGKPILSAIDRAALTDVLVVVVRYFGGTKLGTGGLARAYGEAAALALREASVVTHVATARVQASFPHAMIGPVMRVISKVGARIVDTQYEEDVSVVLEVRLSRARELVAALVDHTRGNVAVREGIPPGDEGPGGMPGKH